MKSKVFFILLLFSSMLLFSFSKKISINIKFEVLKHYNQTELSILLQQQKYSKEFTINLNKRTIIVSSDQNYNTILALYDNNGKLLDSLAVMFMYQLANSCNMYSSEAFCIEGYSPNTSNMIFYLVYCNDDLENFMLFPINRKDFWGLYADAQNIYYSLEFENETVNRINILDGSSYSYPDCFPGGVNIFSYKGEQYFNYTEKGITTTYKLLENKIEKCLDFINDIPKKEIVF